MKMIKLLATGAFFVLLAACGGGGGSAGSTNSGGGGGSTTIPTTATPATIELLTDGASLGSGGGSTLAISAVVKDTNNVGMSAQSVTFSVTSGNLSLANGGVSNSSGVASANLAVGQDKTLREITLRASSGSASAVLVIPVVGTQVIVNGPLSLKTGDFIRYSLKLSDSAGNPISGQEVRLVSSLGNTISNSGVAQTAPTGIFEFTYTANNPGIDTLTASGLGATSAIRPVISAIDFVVRSPSASTVVPVGTPQPVTVRYSDGTNNLAGRIVNFSTTRGSLSAPSAVTDASGDATVTVSSTSAGPASVVATIATVGQVTLPLQFAAITPASVALQANPGAVLPNPAGTTNNQAAIEAIVRDVNGNAVFGRQVNFNLVSDSSGGSLSQPSAVSDVNGKASVQFIPGAISTAANGVVVQASVVGFPAVTNAVRLTVNGESLFISIAFGNVISNEDVTLYKRPFSVYVTDANGGAVAKKAITLRVIPITYGKGVLSYLDAQPATSTTAAISAGWGYASRTVCPNEDTNLNGQVDPGEDINSNGTLQPGIPAFLRPSTVTTDDSGFARFDLIYGEQYALWINSRIEARSTVGGTESVSSIVYFFEGLAADFTDAAVSPANRISPFGTIQSCTSPN